MNPNSEIDRDRLFRAMQWSYRQLEPFRNLTHGLVQEYAGSSYGQGTTRPKFEILMNLMNQTVDAYTMSLVANRPRVMVTANDPALAYFAMVYQTAINNMMQEIHLEETLRQSVLDAFFCMGIVKVHLLETIPVMADTDLWADPGTPFASNVSIDNWVHDMAAPKYSRIQYACDWYRIPYEDLKSDMFDQGVVRELDLRPTTKWGFGEQAERLDRIAIGAETDTDEVEPMIDVVDVWIPRDKMVYTFPVDPQHPFNGQKKPIAAIPPDDPDAGPYDILSFGDVPENIVPSSPASHLSGMMRIINNMMRKQSRKAHGQKDVFTFTPAGAPDAEKLKKASDQQMVPVQEQSEINIMKMGGVDQTLQAFMQAMIQLYDRMAGNLSAMAGLGNQAPTLGQEEMIQGNVSKREANMQYRVVEHALRVIKRLGRMLWDDVAKVIPGSFSLPGLESYPPVDATWMPGEREGEFNDYTFQIDLYSMPFQSPQKKFGVMVQLLQNVFLPAAPILMQQGTTIDFKKVAESAAQFLNAPEMKEWIKSAPAPVAEEEPGGMPTRNKEMEELSQAPGSTTRNYVRRSVATGGSPQNLSTMAEQAWLGNAAGQEQPERQTVGAS